MHGQIHSPLDEDETWNSRTSLDPHSTTQADDNSQAVHHCQDKSLHLDEGGKKPSRRLCNASAQVLDQQGWRVWKCLSPSSSEGHEILTATMAPAYFHDELEHNEKQLKHFKVNHAHNHKLGSKVSSTIKAGWTTTTKNAKFFCSDTDSKSIFLLKNKDY